MASSLSCFTLVLILLSSYTFGNCATMAGKKVDLSNGSTTHNEHQISHAMDDVAAEARQKRSQQDFSSSEYRDFNEIIDDLDDNSIVQAAATQPHDLDFENMPPLTYFLLLQKLRQLQSIEPTYRVRRPRLGRSIDFRQMDGRSDDGDDAGNGGADNMRRQKQFVSRLIKKSVPFKPRLGKRTQQAMLCD